MTAPENENDPQFIAALIKGFPLDKKPDQSLEDAQKTSGYPFSDSLEYAFNSEAAYSPKELAHFRKEAPHHVRLRMHAATSQFDQLSKALDRIILTNQKPISPGELGAFKNAPALINLLIEDANHSGGTSQDSANESTKCDTTNIPYSRRESAHVVSTVLYAGESEEAHRQALKARNLHEGVLPRFIKLATALNIKLNKPSRSVGF